MMIIRPLWQISRTLDVGQILREMDVFSSSQRDELGLYNREFAMPANVKIH